MLSRFRLAESSVVAAAFLLNACVAEPPGQAGVANTQPALGAAAVASAQEGAFALVVEGEGLRFFER